MIKQTSMKDVLDFFQHTILNEIENFSKKEFETEYCSSMLVHFQDTVNIHIDCEIEKEQYMIRLQIMDKHIQFTSFVFNEETKNWDLCRQTDFIKLGKYYLFNSFLALADYCQSRFDYYLQKIEDDTEAFDTWSILKELETFAKEGIDERILPDDESEEVLEESILDLFKFLDEEADFK